MAADNTDQAREWYAKAVEWMEKNWPDDPELQRFRAEASELLGIDEEANGNDIPKEDE